MPTYNRANFVRRHLAYLDSVEFDRDKITIIVGDSSEGEEEAATRKAVEDFAGSLNIEHQSHPKRNVAKASLEMARTVRTPYAAWVGDDDFQIPRGLIASAEYLEKNADYSSASGVCVSLITENSDPFGQVVACKYRYQPVREEERFAERYLRCMQEGIDTLFYVHRRDEMERLFQCAYEIDDIRFAGLIFPRVFSVATGKSKVFPDLRLVRHKNENRYAYSYTDELDWFCDPDFAKDLRLLEERVVNTIMEVDGLSREEATLYFKKGFSYDLIRELHLEYFGKSFNSGQDFYMVPNLMATASRQWMESESYIHSWNKSLTSLRRAWKKLSGKQETSRVELFHALLEPGHPYHADFMPIYNSIMSGAQKMEVEAPR